MRLEKYIDHTLLKPEATSHQISELCAEAKRYHFQAVCINPTHVKLASDLLKGCDVKVCTVVGFPLGANTTYIKECETKKAIEDGADEIDMVINIGAMKDQNFNLVAQEIESLSTICHKKNKILKVIFETCLLTQEEIIEACRISELAGADFIKTSTGMSSAGASFEVVELMRKNTLPHVQIKASGGIRDQETALQYIELGATRLGTSSGIAILRGEKGTTQY